jgi:hypothetical protein
MLICQAHHSHQYHRQITRNPALATPQTNKKAPQHNTLHPIFHSQTHHHISTSYSSSQSIQLNLSFLPSIRCISLAIYLLNHSSKVALQYSSLSVSQSVDHSAAAAAHLQSRSTRILFPRACAVNALIHSNPILSHLFLALTRRKQRMNRPPCRKAPVRTELHPSLQGRARYQNITY